MKEAAVDAEDAVVAYEQAAKVLQPSQSTLDLPAFSEAAVCDRPVSANVPDSCGAAPGVRCRVGAIVRAAGWSRKPGLR